MKIYIWIYLYIRVVQRILTSKTCQRDYIYQYIDTDSETLNNEYIERIHQMSYSSLSDNGMMQIFSFLIK